MLDALIDVLKEKRVMTFKEWKDKIKVRLSIQQKTQQTRS